MTSSLSDHPSTTRRQSARSDELESLSQAKAMLEASDPGPTLVQPGGVPINGGTPFNPLSLACLFHGKSYLEMDDDWG